MIAAVVGDHMRGGSVYCWEWRPMAAACSEPSADWVSEGSRWAAASPRTASTSARLAKPSITKMRGADEMRTGGDHRLMVWRR
eukprot:scaffold238515_cov32-Tisochrysis_lutea.AAC.1